MIELAEEWRNHMVESAAEASEELMDNMLQVNQALHYLCLFR